MTLLGFISFPVFTRILPVAEYGVLNLVTRTLLMVVVITKLGIQHSVVRFYEECRTSSDPLALVRTIRRSIGPPPYWHFCAPSSSRRLWVPPDLGFRARQETDAGNLVVGVHHHDDQPADVVLSRLGPDQEIPLPCKSA